MVGGRICLDFAPWVCSASRPPTSSRAELAHSEHNHAVRHHTDVAGPFVFASFLLTMFPLASMDLLFSSAFMLTNGWRPTPASTYT